MQTVEEERMRWLEVLSVAIDAEMRSKPSVVRESGGSLRATMQEVVRRAIRHTAAVNKGQAPLELFEVDGKLRDPNRDLAIAYDPERSGQERESDAVRQMAERIVQMVAGGALRERSEISMEAALIDERAWSWSPDADELIASTSPKRLRVTVTYR